MKDQPAQTCTGMRVLPKVVTVTRRGFLRGGAMAIGAAAAGPAALAASNDKHLAQDFPTLGAATAQTLLRMARDVFPHDKLADRYYVEAIQPFERAAARDPKQAALFRDGVRDLDKAAMKRFGKPYAAVKREPATREQTDGAGKADTSLAMAYSPRASPPKYHRRWRA